MNRKVGMNDNLFSRRYFFFGSLPAIGVGLIKPYIRHGWGMKV